VSWRHLAAITLFVLASGAVHADSCGKLFSVASESGGWNAIEAATEKQFQEVVGAGNDSRDTLENLNDKLDRYGWTLTRYTVRLLHELQADSLPEASERLVDDTYTSSALRDAMWDGFNGWSIVSSLKPETLEILQRLEAVRTGVAEFPAGESGDGDKAGNLRRALAGKAQKVTERLLKEAANEEPAGLNARAGCGLRQSLKLAGGSND